MSAADIEAMRRDYEAGMTLRAIALKYGCSKSQADRIAKKKGWDRPGGTKGHCPKQMPQKPKEPKPKRHPAEPIDPAELPELEAKTEFQIVQSYTYKLLDKVGEVLDDPMPLGARDLRSIASTLLDVRNLLNAVSPVEAEEQRLRIESLRRQTEAISGDKEEIDVSIMGMSVDEMSEVIG